MVYLCQTSLVKSKLLPLGSHGPKKICLNEAAVLKSCLASNASDPILCYEVVDAYVKCAANAVNTKV